MKSKLTELSVARIRPPQSGRLEVWDSTLPAFGLRITAAGARSYVVAIRKPGATHPSRIKVGEPGTMSLADARSRARELMADPGALEPQEQAPADTVADVITQFIERYHKPRNRHWREIQQILTRELAPWLYRPIRSITRRDVIERLEAIAARAPIRSNRVRAALNRMLGWAVERDILAISPAIGVRPLTREFTRDRVLTPDELAAIWRAAEALPWPWSPIIKLLILTAARRGEVASMRWDDLDLEARVWTVPAAVNKAGRLHEIPLSDLAMETIAGLPRIGLGDMVFPSLRVGGISCEGSFSRIKRQLDDLSGVTGWHLHDVRRTAASGMARLGQPPHVVAAVLNHAPGQTMGITAVYLRHRYGDEKRAALNAWAREVDRILGRGEAKVVAFR